MVVKLDKKMGLADLSCKVCGQKFQTGINCEWNFLPHSRELTNVNHPKDLSAGVDVYSDWVDACDKVAKEACEDEDTAKHDGQRLARSKPRANSAADTRDLEPANTDEDEEDISKRDGQRLARERSKANSAADTRDLGPANSYDD